MPEEREESTSFILGIANWHITAWQGLKLGVSTHGAAAAATTDISFRLCQIFSRSIQGQALAIEVDIIEAKTDSESVTSLIVGEVEEIADNGNSIAKTASNEQREISETSIMENESYNPTKEGKYTHATVHSAWRTLESRSKVDTAAQLSAEAKGLWCASRPCS